MIDVNVICAMLAFMWLGVVIVIGIVAMIHLVIYARMTGSFIYLTFLDRPRFYRGSRSWWHDLGGIALNVGGAVMLLYLSVVSLPLVKECVSTYLLTLN